MRWKALFVAVAVMFAAAADAQPAKRRGGIKYSNAGGGGGIAAGDSTDFTGSNSFLDGTYFTLKDDVDPTKLLRFQLSSITAGQTRTITVPDADLTLPTAFIGGSVGTVDECLARANGVGGATLQGYTSGCPTAADTGLLTANAGVSSTGTGTFTKVIFEANTKGGVIQKNNIPFVTYPGYEESEAAPFLFARLSTTKTNGSGAPYAVTRDDVAGRLFNNTGATAEVYLTLFSADHYYGDGAHYVRGLVTDGDGLRFTLPASEFARAGANITSAAGAIKSFGIGSSIEFQSDQASTSTTYSALSGVGSWILDDGTGVTFSQHSQAPTIADSGDGSAAAATFTPLFAGSWRITCSDANGCDVTMGETNVPDGLEVTFTNSSANTVNFADTAGVTELAGAFAAGQYDSLTLVYQADRWIEKSRSNN